MSYDNYRCPVCGGKLRIVNVIKVDTFRRPEATQYDLSVSRRKGKIKFGKTSPQEWMCSSCANRLPIVSTKAETKADKEKVKAEKPLKPKKEKKKKKIDRKKRDAFLTKVFITLIVLCILAYFAYAYRDTIQGYWDKIMSIVGKVEEVVDKIASKF